MRGVRIIVMMMKRTNKIKGVITKAKRTFRKVSFSAIPNTKTRRPRRVKSKVRLMAKWVSTNPTLGQTEEAPKIWVICVRENATPKRAYSYLPKSSHQLHA